MTRMEESKAMEEVRAWKAECDAEVEHLSDQEAVRKRLADSAKIAEGLGLQYAPAMPLPSPHVAEVSAKYQAVNQDTDDKNM